MSRLCLETSLILIFLAVVVAAMVVAEDAAPEEEANADPAPNAPDLSRLRSAKLITDEPSFGPLLLLRLSFPTFGYRLPQAQAAATCAGAITLAGPASFDANNQIIDDP